MHRLAVVAAGLLGGWLIARDARRWPISARDRVHVLIVVALGGMLGSSLPGLVAGGVLGGNLASWMEAQADAGLALGSVLLLGPKTVLGGLLGGFIAISLFKRPLGVTHDTSDAFARGTAVMMAVGRLGCIAQHCCFGASCSLAIGVDQGDGILRWPVQVIEFLAQCLLLLVVFGLHARNWLPGRRLFVVFFSYGLLRFMVEFLREPLGATWHGVGFYQALALLVAGIGAWHLVKRSRARQTPG